jgi:NADH-quinone oxidoreductase subunit F
MPVISMVKKFRKEFEDHLEGKPCPYEEGLVEQLPVLSAWDHRTADPWTHQH